MHNLKNLSLDVPLRQLVGIAGVSGSGKSRLRWAFYTPRAAAATWRRASTYTRRRISQAGRATVDEVLHVPAAIALRQRPGIPGVHSTFGTSTELLNYLRLMFSRLGCHVCPNGHVNAPTLNVAADLPITCSTCGVEFYGPSAEDLAFNSGGALPHLRRHRRCARHRRVHAHRRSQPYPEEGAVAPGATSCGRSCPRWPAKWACASTCPKGSDRCREGHRTARAHGEAPYLYVPKNKDHATELDFTYYSAVNTVRRRAGKAKDEKGMARAKFLCESVCPDCHGTRLSGEGARPPSTGATSPR